MTSTQYFRKYRQRSQTDNSLHQPQNAFKLRPSVLQQM